MDYVKLLVKVNKLIVKNGRSVTFWREGRADIDPSKPWKGPMQEIDGGDSKVTFVTKGVFVPPNTVREFGITSLGEGTLVDSMISMSQEIVIIAGTEIDLKQFKMLTDGPRDWGIRAIQVLRPADISVLAFVGVRR